MNRNFIKLLIAIVFTVPAFAGPTLPQVEITYSGSLSKNMNSYIAGSMVVTDTDGTVLELPNVLLKTRGATASAFTQKPALNVKLRDEAGEEQNVNLLGLRSASTFILDAMAIDRINMRNRVAFDIWNSFSRLPYETEFGDRNGTVGAFVEVTLNGKYKGIYCLSDKINRKLLDLKKPQVDEATGEVTIRGVLYKNGTNDIGNQNTPGFFNDYIDYVALYHDAWELHEPEEYASPEAWAPLVDLYANRSSYSYVKEHFWLENLADYTIHIMALSIQDNWGAKNRYFSIQNSTKSDDKGKFVITPWDLDCALGGHYNGNYYGGNYSNWLPQDVTKNAPVPISPCIGQTEFKTLLRERWVEGSCGPFAVDSVIGRMDSIADLFIKSGAWDRSLAASNSDDKLVNDLKEEVRLIGEWYAARFEQMDRYFGVTDSDREQVAGIGPTYRPEPAPGEENPTIYTLQGIPVRDVTSPGIYIVGGKKIKY